MLPAVKGIGCYGFAELRGGGGRTALPPSLISWPIDL